MLESVLVQHLVPLLVQHADPFVGPSVAPSLVHQLDPLAAPLMICLKRLKGEGEDILAESNMQK
jgi:hypothetical protein